MTFFPKWFGRKRKAVEEVQKTVRERKEVYSPAPRNEQKREEDDSTMSGLTAAAILATEAFDSNPDPTPSVDPTPDTPSDGGFSDNGGFGGGDFGGGGAGGSW